MKRQEKDEKFQWVLFSDLFLSTLKPLLISRSKAKTKKMLVLLQKSLHNSQTLHLKFFLLISTFQAGNASGYRRASVPNSLLLVVEGFIPDLQYV